MPVDIDTLLRQMPVISILRGITPHEIIGAGTILSANNINIIEVPLNSPQAYESIERLAEHFSDRCVCGAGTVLRVEQVDRVFQAGGRLIVSPNTNPRVIRRTLELGMIPVPGFATPTEAFSASDAGATLLKLFPASLMGVDYLQALATVLPATVRIVATGGINAGNMPDWLAAGATGLGIGGDLYRPGLARQKLEERAIQLANSYAAFKKNNPEPVGADR